MPIKANWATRLKKEEKNFLKEEVKCYTFDTWHSEVFFFETKRNKRRSLLRGGKKREEDIIKQLERRILRCVWVESFVPQRCCSRNPTIVIAHTKIEKKLLSNSELSNFETVSACCLSCTRFNARPDDGASCCVITRLTASKQRLSTSHCTIQQQQCIEWSCQQQLRSSDGCSCPTVNDNSASASIRLTDATEQQPSNGSEHSTRRDSIKSNVTTSHASVSPPSQRCQRCAHSRAQQRSPSQWIIPRSGLCQRVLSGRRRCSSARCLLSSSRAVSSAHDALHGPSRIW